MMISQHIMKEGEREGGNLVGCGVEAVHIGEFGTIIWSISLDLTSGVKLGF